MRFTMSFPFTFYYIKRIFFRNSNSYYTFNHYIYGVPVQKIKQIVLIARSK